jgi:hypothetical protein
MKNKLGLARRRWNCTFNLYKRESYFLPWFIASNLMHLLFFTFPWITNKFHILLPMQIEFLYFYKNHQGIENIKWKISATSTSALKILIILHYKSPSWKLSNTSHHTITRSLCLFKNLISCIPSLPYVA